MKKNIMLVFLLLSSSKLITVNFNPKTENQNEQLNNLMKKFNELQEERDRLLLKNVKLELEIEDKIYAHKKRCLEIKELKKQIDLLKNKKVEGKVSIWQKIFCCGRNKVKEN